MKKLILGLFIIIATCAGLFSPAIGGLPVIIGLIFVYFGTVNTINRYFN